MYTILGVIFAMQIFTIDVCGSDTDADMLEYPSFSSAARAEIPGLNSTGFVTLLGVDAYAEGGVFYEEKKECFANASRIFAFSTSNEDDRDSCRFVSINAANAAGGKKAVLQILDPIRPSICIILPCVLVACSLEEISDAGNLTVLMSLDDLASDNAHLLGAQSEIN